MIRVISLFLFLSTIFVARAQDIEEITPSTKQISPDQGDVMIELNFNPIGLIEVFEISELKAKFWLSENIVFRIGVPFSVYNQNKPSNDLDKSSIEKKAFSLGIAPGLEHRFLIGSKVSPYIGAEVMYNRGTGESVENTDFGNGNTTEKVLKGATDYGVFYDEITGDPSKFKNRAFYSFGANAIFGADYFFTKNIYMGIEVGFGVTQTQYEEVTLEVNSSSQVLSGSLKQTNFGFNYNDVFRLGVNF